MLSVSGFDDYCGLDLEIKLEEPTRKICRDLLINSVGLQKFFENWKTLWKGLVSREGKADIYLVYNSECWVIELKGFDPSPAEIRKDIVRLIEFLAVNAGDNKCKECFLAFPTQRDRKDWIESLLRKIKQTSGYAVHVYSKRFETREDPEDGIPVYHANCISISRLHQLWIIV